MVHGAARILIVLLIYALNSMRNYLAYIFHLSFSFDKSIDKLNWIELKWYRKN